MQRRHERPLRRVNPSGKTVWVARYTGRDGKRRSAGTYDLKRDAQDAILAAYKTDPEGARAGEAVTIGQYAAQWTRERPRSVRTDETNDSRLAAVLGPVTALQLLRASTRSRRRGEAFQPWSGVEIDGTLLRDWPIEAFRRRHANMLLNLLLAEGRAALGAKGILSTLSAMWRDAMEDELADHNPFAEIRVRQNDPRVKKAPRRARVLSWQDMHRLASAAGDYEAMVRVPADCGLRLGELLALYREDMKLGPCGEDGCRVDGPHFHVRRTAHKGVVTVGTKRERLRDKWENGRVVPISPGLEALLREWPRRIDTPLLFPTETGKVYFSHNFRVQIWTPAVAASGVTATPQDFRHSWVSNMRAAGIDPADLAAMAGHSEIVATAVYTHALQQSFESARRVVGA